MPPSIERTRLILLWTTVDFETFSKILNRPGGFRDPGEPEEYCRGFQVFDKDMTGFIGVGQLRYILTNLGEKMSDDEVDELLKAVDTQNGEVNYTGMFNLFGAPGWTCVTIRNVERILMLMFQIYRTRTHDSRKLEPPICPSNHRGVVGQMGRVLNCRT